MNHEMRAMTRLTTLLTFLLALALSSTITYWVVQWTAPAPRLIAEAPTAVQPVLPITAAASLFGGRAQPGLLTNLQLRGVVHADRSPESVAIITMAGKSSRALRIGSEIAPGVRVKQILEKSVVVSEQDVDRELALPAFAAQETQSPTSVALQPSPAPSAHLATVGSSGSSGSGSSAPDGAGQSGSGRGGSGQNSPGPASPGSPGAAGRSFEPVTRPP